MALTVFPGAEDVRVMEARPPLHPLQLCPRARCKRPRCIQEMGPPVVSPSFSSTWLTFGPRPIFELISVKDRRSLSRRFLSLAYGWAA